MNLLDIIVAGVLIIALIVVVANAGKKVKVGDVAFDAAQWRADRSGCSFFPPAFDQKWPRILRID